MCGTWDLTNSHCYYYYQVTLVAIIYFLSCFWGDGYRQKNLPEVESALMLDNLQPAHQPLCGVCDAGD